MKTRGWAAFATLVIFGAAAGCGKPAETGTLSTKSPEEQIKQIEHDTSMPPQVRQAELARLKKLQSGGR